MTTIFVVFLSLLHQVVVLAGWANDLGGMLSRSCMYGFGLSAVSSEYDDTTGDRLWEVQCGQVGLLRGDDTCLWTYDFINKPGEKIKFSCKDDDYIAGLYSDYNRTAQDRVWRLECCHSPGVRIDNCHDSGDWLNKYTENMELNIGPKQVLQGLVSVYKPEQRDRKWRFTVCDFHKISDAEDQSLAKDNI